MIVSLSDLSVFCDKIQKRFQKKQLVLLNGPMGVGKTQFVKSCVSLLGGTLPDSPTFSIINQYSSLQRTIYHVDLYRLESAEDIESTGFWDLFREEEAVIFVEWAEKISAENWPKTWTQLEIDMAFTAKSDERSLTLSRNFEGV